MTAVPLFPRNIRAFYLYFLFALLTFSLITKMADGQTISKWSDTKNLRQATSITESPELPIIVVDEDNISSLVPTIVDPCTPPTPNPSASPTFSAEPTISSQPTMSMQPSDVPSSMPSESPSLVPSVSLLPSFIPSDTPSLSPSISSAPSSLPSISHMPTMTRLPSSAPSEIPTGAPISLPPSPTSIAPTSLLPVVSVGSVTQDNIYMVLRNVPAPLGVEEGRLWENITEHHVLRFYADVQRAVPGLLNFNVSAVYDTIIRKQTFTSFHTAPEASATSVSSTETTTDSDLGDAEDESSSSSSSPPAGSFQQLGQLELEYSQTIDYVVFVSLESVNEDMIRHRVFTLPFQNDAQDYIFDLAAAFNYNHWIDLQVINANPTAAPTELPRPNFDGSTNLPRWAVPTISVGLVMAAILLVVFLFWERHRREQYKATHDRVMLETLEHDNAGNAGDWRNPFGTLSQDHAPPPGAAAAATTPPSHDRRGTMNTNESRSRTSHDTTQSTVVAAATPPDPGALRSTSVLPPATSDVDVGGESNRSDGGRPFSTTNMGNSGGPMQYGIFSTPPRLHRLESRHVSVANTEMTDLTFSEVGDRASDGAELFTLPPISDEAYMIQHDNDENHVPMDSHTHYDDEQQDLAVPWSSLHIPQTDSYGTIHNDGLLLLQSGMVDPGIAQHLTGFEMQIEELE